MSYIFEYLVMSFWVFVVLNVRTSATHHVFNIFTQDFLTRTLKQSNIMIFPMIFATYMGNSLSEAVTNPGYDSLSNLAVAAN